MWAFELWFRAPTTTGLWWARCIFAYVLLETRLLHRQDAGSLGRIDPEGSLAGFGDRVGLFDVFEI